VNNSPADEHQNSSFLALQRNGSGRYQLLKREHIAASHGGHSGLGRQHS
jgi:hypothetical protein